MGICPIVSTKDHLSDCIGSDCAFFDGCLILQSIDAIGEHSEAIESLQDDVGYCRGEVDGVRLDLDDLIRS